MKCNSYNILCKSHMIKQHQKLKSINSKIGNGKNYYLKKNKTTIMENFYQNL